jgi:hypothetical protein
MVAHLIVLAAPDAASAITERRIAVQMPLYCTGIAETGGGAA